jgi:hypothetical protein
LLQRHVHETESDHLDGYAEFEYASLLLDLGQLDEASRRAEAVLRRESQCPAPQPLWQGLNRMIKARVLHLRSVDGGDPSLLVKAESEFNAVIADLESAGEQQHKPRGYLLQAALKDLVGETKEALADIDKAYSIAQSYGMPILLAAACISYADHYLTTQTDGSLYKSASYWSRAVALTNKHGCCRWARQLVEQEERISAAQCQFLQTKYNAVHDGFIHTGVDLERFHGNPRYCVVDENGNVSLNNASHPTLANWPLTSYPGGPELVASLASHVAALDKTLAENSVVWIDNNLWHSTVFEMQPGSSMPDSRRGQTYEDIVTAVTKSAISYRIRFTRIIVAPDGAILAVGYPDNIELSVIRGRLASEIKDGGASALVHITLGRIVEPINKKTTKRLINFINGFTDSAAIGEIEIDHLRLCHYSGPVTQPKLTVRSSHVLRKPWA